MPSGKKIRRSKLARPFVITLRTPKLEETSLPMAVTQSRVLTISLSSLQATLTFLGHFLKNRDVFNELGIFLSGLSYHSDQVHLITSCHGIESERFAELLILLGEDVERFRNWSEAFGHSTNEDGHFLIRLGSISDRRRHRSFRFLNFIEGVAFFEWLQSCEYWHRELGLVLQGFWSDEALPQNSLAEFVSVQPLNGLSRVDVVYSKLYHEHMEQEKRRSEITQKLESPEHPKVVIEIDL